LRTIGEAVLAHRDELCEVELKVERVLEVRDVVLERIETKEKKMLRMRCDGQKDRKVGSTNQRRGNAIHESERLWSVRTRSKVDVCLVVQQRSYTVK